MISAVAQDVATEQGRMSLLACCRRRMGTSVLALRLRCERKRQRRRLTTTAKLTYNNVSVSAANVVHVARRARVCEDLCAHHRLWPPQPRLRSDPVYVTAVTPQDHHILLPHDLSPRPTRPRDPRFVRRKTLS